MPGRFQHQFPIQRLDGGHTDDPGGDAAAGSTDFTFRRGQPMELRTCSKAQPAANMLKPDANGAARWWTASLLHLAAGTDRPGGLSKPFKPSTQNRLKSQIPLLLRSFSTFS